MKIRLCILAVLVFLILSASLAIGQDAPVVTLVEGRLIDPGSAPFYLQAVITENTDPDEHVDVEMSWVAPDKWRRTIKSEDFSQTLVVNGDRTFEQDSDLYFPLGLRVITTALVDPADVVNALRPGDLVRTKANGKADESGPYGLLEWVGAAGHSVSFTDYHNFKDKRIARLLRYTIEIGDFLEARVTTLGELERYDESQFAIAEPTPREKLNRSVILSEAELRTLATQPMEVIWPQILDDPRTSGLAKYCVSINRSGQVREIFPLRVSFKEADDSVRRQIMKWKFKPPLKDGVPVQAEAVLDLTFETRAYGPPSPLTDAEVRKLATNTVDPEFPLGSKTGATCNIRIAVDAEGKVIQQLAGAGASELTAACMNAVARWKFSPIIENGQPRPYRAEITFRVP